MKQINRMSRVIRYLALTYMAATPVMSVLLWTTYTPGEPSFFNFDSMLAVNPDMILSAPTTTTRLLGCLASLLPVSVTMFGSWQLAGLFALYERGIVFEHANVRCYRLLAWTILIREALAPVNQALSSIILTMNNPEGQRMVAVGVSDANLGWIVLGLIGLVVARIMDDAREMQEERQLTI
ncbi:DUF2975 domain-containing protein [Pseudodesulfovibrio tunisiensis]|uniref:DUF2975 domain-containing protein n=1 Tax=Pseudodesulfovibrio tunisiensis TaxID=463192 RepID=UPI001FB3ED34|nr:DUF2975 domain-containing protein [Pseudodesulfovibrio tunisiensis]